MDPQVTDKPLARLRFSHILLGIFVTGLIAFAVFLAVHRPSREIVSGFVGDPAVNLASSEGRTNLVLMGVGGEGHEGPDLTDSIMFVSIRHSDSDVKMISVPRDIWVDTLKAKINTAYHYGNERREGGGRDLAKSAVAEVLGVPVHYAVIIDFAVFVKAIDAVGGIDVEVERTFDDLKYPVPGKENVEPESDRYEHLHFDAGLNHMDGATALKFARSRYAEGEEGTDFARGARQQKIMLAFKDKLLSTQTLLDSEARDRVIGSLASSIDTDIPSDDYGSFIKLFLGFEKSGSPTKSIVISDQFINPRNTAPYGRQWVLIPVTDWEELHTYVADSLK